jgi:hypothetical protein
MRLFVSKLRPTDKTIETLGFISDIRSVLSMFCTELPLLRKRWASSFAPIMIIWALSNSKTDKLS